MATTRTYYVYIMASRSRVLYIGVTNDIVRRVWQHRQRSIKGFSRKYNTTRLVYLEQAENSTAAIAREKVLKGWLRTRKVALIESLNPSWDDLAESWFSESSTPPSGQGSFAARCALRSG